MTIPTYQFHLPNDEQLPFEIANIEDKTTLHNVSHIARRDHFYVIFLVTSGQGVYNIDFQQYSIQPNMFFCIAPHQVHFWQIEEAITGKLIVFTEGFLTTTFAYPSMHISQNFTLFNWETPAGFTIPGQANNRFNTIVNILLDEYTQAESVHRELAIQSALLLLLISAQRMFDKDIQRDLLAGTQLTQEFLFLVNNHFVQTSQVSDYADMLGVTAGHLADTISEIMGQTPLSIIHSRLILEAKRLLIHTHDPASTIANHLSFTDPSYFGRFFKREVGQTPKQFRNSFR